MSNSGSGLPENGTRRDAVLGLLGVVAGVTGVHDLHLWSVAGDDASLTAHVAVADEGNAETIRRTLTEMLETRFAIHHATIQTETEPCGDEESLHR